MVRAVVREWRDEEGWGVLDCPQTPGGCFAHFSSIEIDGYRSLRSGAVVELERWESLDFTQDGYDYRATKVIP